MSKIELRGIRKKYPNSDAYAVKDFNLEIAEGEFIVFVGPSGCGKSTTLRMIAGLEEITEGEFFIDGVKVNDLSSKDRDIAMVFQSYALYPHMTVRDNIGYGLKLRHVNKDDINKRVDKIASYLGVDLYLDRKPKALSGGQRQRVALGRAMIRTPKIYLMDEPLSNLDAKLRTTTRTEISRMHRSKGAVTIYVTHDQVEAMTMADRIVLMSMGEVQQIGPPKELYTNPRNLFVATFMGMPPMSTIKGRYHDKQFSCNKFTIKLNDEDCQILSQNGYEGKEVRLGVRSSAIKHGIIAEHAFPGGIITIEPINVEYLGDGSNVFFEPEPGSIFIASVDSNAPIEIDVPTKLVIDTDNLHFFDITSEKSIKYDHNFAKNC
jgi:multiple sugar transport system ATP-binding protein